MRWYRHLPTVAGTVLLPAVLLVAGCAEAGTGADGDGPAQARLYGSSGVMQDGFGAGLIDPGVLVGMKGTAPGAPLPTGFTNRLQEVDPSVTEFRYAAETYDAVVISALAAELAGTPDPEVVRDFVVGVTTGGERCTAVADCLELARAGEQLAYRGVSLHRSGFTEAGEPAAASYATLHFGPDSRIDRAKTEFVSAGSPAAAAEVEPPEPDPLPTGSLQAEPLRFGGLLPETGALASESPPLVAGALLAVAEINDAGGVFGVDVEWFPGDDGTLDAEVARETVADHVADGVHVVIGAMASETTTAVLPDVVAAQRILFSPASTAASLREADHDGYFFRTAPPDDLQGAALADVLLRDGTERVAIVARDDELGRDLQADVVAALHRFGVPNADITLLTYRPPDSDELPVPGREQVAEEVIAVGPDAVLMIGSSEAAQVIEAMIDTGLRVLAGPGTVS